MNESRSSIAISQGRMQSSSKIKSKKKRRTNWLEYETLLPLVLATGETLVSWRSGGSPGSTIFKTGKWRGDGCWFDERLLFWWWWWPLLALAAATVGCNEDTHEESDVADGGDMVWWCWLPIIESKMSISVGTKSLDEPGLTTKHKLQKLNFNKVKCQSNCLGK